MALTVDCQSPRQRKIKCGKCHSKRRCCHSHLPLADEKRPSCSACTRLGVTCPGPQIRTTFIREHPDQPGKASSRQVILPPSATSLVSQNLSTSSSQCMVVQAWLSRQCLHAAQGWNISLPKEDHYTTLFVSKFKTEAVGVWAPFTWLNNDLVAYNGNASISRRFAQNLAQAFFGHYFALPQVLNAAQAEYGRNLLILKNSLDAPKIVASDDLFRGILTAVVFELIVQTSSTAWIIHLLALARIIQVSKAYNARVRSGKHTIGMTSRPESRTKCIPNIVRKVRHSYVPIHSRKDPDSLYHLAVFYQDANILTPLDRICNHPSQTTILRQPSVAASFFTTPPR